MIIITVIINATSQICKSKVKENQSDANLMRSLKYWSLLLLLLLCLIHTHTHLCNRTHSLSLSSSNNLVFHFFRSFSLNYFLTSQFFPLHFLFSPSHFFSLLSFSFPFFRYDITMNLLCYPPHFDITIYVFIFIFLI